MLSKFATAYFANKNHNKTKSDQNYVSKSVKALGFPLQGLPEVEKSKGFKALRNNFTIDLENFCMSIMQKYVFPVNDLNVKAKKHQFYIAFCKLLHGLVTIYIAQSEIRGYPKDVAIANLVTAKNDTILVPINMNTKQFLKAYIKAHGIQVFPKPTIENDIADLIDKVNGAPPIGTAANVDANQEESGKAAPPQDQAEGANDRNQDNEMMELTANAELIGDKVTVCRNILDAIMKCVIKPVQQFHKQRLDNKEAKQIKVAITLPQVSDTAQQVAQVVASEQPAKRPVLCGLIQETASKSTSNLEKHLQSLEDKLKAATLKAGKTAAKNEKGDGTKSPLKRILQKKGKPAALNPVPKKKSASTNTRAQGGNNNATMRDNKKKKPKKPCISFDGNKEGQHTN